MMKIGETLYFEKDSADNTIKTLEMVQKAVVRLKIGTVIVASTTGETAVKTGEILGNSSRIIAVPFQLDRRAKWGAPTAGNITRCIELGIEFMPKEPKVPFIDSERPDIINAWRCLSRGFKVAIQCASMCVDTGLIKNEATVIAVGGRVHGADTAIILQAYGYDSILKSNVIEVLALPQYT